MTTELKALATDIKSLGFVVKYHPSLPSSILVIGILEQNGKKIDEALTLRNDGMLEARPVINMKSQGGLLYKSTNHYLANL